MRHDLWFAWRRIRLRPLHSLVVALTLGLGLGAALAVFAIVDAVLVRPLPYPAADRIVRITQVLPVDWIPELTFSDVGYRRLATDARTLEAVAAYTTRDVNLIGRDTPRRLVVARTTASLFTVLGVQPALGRAFTAAEDAPNGPRALVLGDALWRSAFAADPAVIGTVANLEGEPYTIVGVLPPWVGFPSRDVAAWEPLRLDPAAANPFNRGFDVIARLRPGVTTEQAVRDVTEPIRAVGREFPGPHSGSALDEAGFTGRVRWLGETVVGDTRPVVVLLLAGVTMLLLLTCANVASLQLAAAVARGEELAVRSALGATRARLVRGALAEGVLLALAGALVGAAVAVVGARLLATLLPSAVAIDAVLAGARVLGVTVLAVVVIGAVVGAVPVALATRGGVAHALRDRASGGSGTSAARVRRVLAAAQVALAVLLLHGSGLLLASAREVQGVRLGFRPDSTISLHVNLPIDALADRGRRESLLRGILADVQAIPGVQVAAVANALPLTPGRRDQAMAMEGRPFKADGTDPLADYRVVSQGYFRAMGIALRAGRTFTDDDATARYTPVVISEGLARQLLPDGSDPVGRRLRFGPASPWMPIIGVVADATNRSVTETPRPEFYVPALGTYSNMALRTEMALVARASVDPRSLVAPIRRAIARRDPSIPTFDVATLDDVVRDSRARMITATRLMSGYALAALLLAVAGTYAVLSYLVAQRRRELAVRLALGATPRDIVALVARESATLIALGTAAGLVAAVGMSRLLAGLLYGVGALDALVVLAVVAVAALAGVGAALVPARRAAGTDPSAALRGGG